MDKVTIKCPLCGNEFTTDNDTDTVVCTGCKQQFSKMQGVKYYKSFYKVKTEEKRVAVGKAYAEVDALIDQAEFYLKEEDFEKASEVIKKAFTLTNSDYRLYLCATMLKTKNFTDYKDKTHLPYFKKAIEYANVEEQKRLKSVYSPFYKKSRIKEDELEDYSMQEASSMKSRIEELLKDGIPNHFKREKRYEITKILLPIFSILTLAGLVLSIALNSSVISIISVALFIAMVVVLMLFMGVKYITKQFNAVLDFYDNFKTFDFTTEEEVKVLKRLEVIAVSYNNNDGDNSMSLNLQKFVNTCLDFNNEKVETYILNDKTLSKYV